MGSPDGICGPASPCRDAVRNLDVQALRFHVDRQTDLVHAAAAHCPRSGRVYGPATLDSGQGIDFQIRWIDTQCSYALGLRSDLAHEAVKQRLQPHSFHQTRRRKVTLIHSRTAPFGPMRSTA
jgi:hypothetical protein